MNAETYYRDHWLEIDPERLDTYEEMFRWRPSMAPLLEPADLRTGQRVVDFGCGPGMLSLELARRAGPEGHVYGVDLNPDFLDRARANAEREGLADRISLHRTQDDRVPLDDRTVDRVICKNVLEYVGDVVATLVDMRRILAPGGLVHAIDSDWGMLVVEPLGPEPVARLFEAASVAYRTPLIGRKLLGMMREAGFDDVRIRISTHPDLRGTLSPIVYNMARYARLSGQIEPAEIDRLLEDLKRSIADGSYLLVLPQFMVTGVAPGAA